MNIVKNIVAGLSTVYVTYKVDH